MKILVIIGFLVLVDGVFGSDDIDPCDIRPTGEEKYPVMYCACNENEASSPIGVECYVNSILSQNSSLDLWEALSTLNTTINLAFLMREKNLIELPPPIIFRKMTGLTGFYIKHSGIHTIKPFAFQNNTSLRQIDLSDNIIRILNIFSFSNLPNLIDLFMDGNQIRTIERDTFYKLFNLKKLRLKGNRIELIRENSFKDLVNLEQLELQRNNLTILTPQIFNGLTNLKILDLMRNTIQFLGEKLFYQLTKLEDLDLTENKIISVHPTAFFGLNQLRRLNLKGNKIVSFESYTFASLKQIYFLDVRNNELESFPKELMQEIYKNLLTEAMHLNLMDNRFKCDCRITWLKQLYFETKSVTVKYYLNQTRCDVPEKDEIGFELDVRRPIQNITLTNGKFEETTAVTVDGSSILIASFNWDKLNCRKSLHQKNAEYENDPSRNKNLLFEETNENSNKLLENNRISEARIKTTTVTNTYENEIINFNADSSNRDGIEKRTPLAIPANSQSNSNLPNTIQFLFKHTFCILILKIYPQNV